MKEEDPVVDVYVVYFDAGSDNCSGWLDTESHDVVCFAHFMTCASQFISREQAIEAAEERLKKIYDLIDRIPDTPGTYAFHFRDKFGKEEKEIDKKRYKYHILKIDILNIGEKSENMKTQGQLI